MLKACLEAVPQTLPPFPHCHLKVALATGIIQHTLGKVDVVRAHQTIVLLGKNLMKGLGSPRLWELLFFLPSFCGIQRMHPQNLDITRQTTGNLANGFVKMGDGQIGATNF